MQRPTSRGCEEASDTSRCSKPEECQAVAADGHHYLITLTASKAESCQTACADVGLTCDDEQLVRLATYAAASDAIYLSFIQAEAPAGMGLSGPLSADRRTPSSGRGFFGIGCGSSEWFFTSFASSLSGCGNTVAKYDSRPGEARCDYTYGNGGSHGAFWGPSICTCI